MEQKETRDTTPANGVWETKTWFAAPAKRRGVDVGCGGGQVIFLMTKHDDVDIRKSVAATVNRQPSSENNSYILLYAMLYLCTALLSDCLCESSDRRSLVCFIYLIVHFKLCHLMRRSWSSAALEHLSSAFDCWCMVLSLLSSFLPCIRINIAVNAKDAGLCYNLILHPPPPLPFSWR